MNPAEYRLMFEAEDSHWWYVGLHELVLEQVAREAGRAGGKLSILDAGCGTGRLCQLMSPFGTVDGCDRSELAVGFCRKRGLERVRLADLNDVDLPPEAYDLVVSLDVLYHSWIADDVAVMRRFHRALKPGGGLVLNLVAWEFMRSTHDLAVGTRERYRRETLRRRLIAAGFEPEKLTYRLFLPFPFIAALRLAKKALWRVGGGEGSRVASDLRKPPAALNRLMLGLVRMENRFLRRHGLPLGSSLFAVARKPGAGAGTGAQRR